jgi:ComF family protein
MPVRSPFDLCAHCSERPPAFSRASAAFVMDGGARRLAHLLKYDGITSLAPVMARLMFSRAPVVDADIVAAVSLHRGRERSRGYNQAALIAAEYARLASAPFAKRAARRVRATVPLVKTMHREERLAAMHGAFAAHAEAVHGKRVLLIDDVMTTGATLDACSTAMLNAGASDVRCLAWARAD